MLMPAGKVHHLRHFGLGDLGREDPHHRDDSIYARLMDLGDEHAHIWKREV